MWKSDMSSDLLYKSSMQLQSQMDNLNIFTRIWFKLKQEKLQTLSVNDWYSFFGEH